MTPLPTSFRGRLTLRWTLAVGLLLALANATIYAGTHLYLHRWLDHNVRTLAATEASSSTDGPNDVHLHEGIFASLDDGAFTEKFVQIFSRDGTLVLQSTMLGNHPPVVSGAVLEEAFAGRAPLMSVNANGRRGRVSVLTARRDDRVYAVAVGLFTDDVENGLRSLAWLLTGVWAVGIAATAGIGYLLASRALRPVSRITERAAWIAQGHFGDRLDPPQVDDEVGRMTRLLNSMLDRLQGAVEANRRFAADASHELRGPLTAMAGELDVALRHERSAADYAATLRHVRGRLDALVRLAEDLILLARTQERTRELVRREVALAPLVDEAFQRLRPPATARGISLTHQGLAGILLYAEPALISRVVDNVVANAVVYNRDGGQVTVTASVEEPPDDAWASPIVVLRVCDTGPGIPATQHERIFERFYRIDHSRARQTGGSGLGLALCREVVALHGGRIRVSDSSPAGTTIEIRIPGRLTAPVPQQEVRPVAAAS